MWLVAFQFSTGTSGMNNKKITALSVLLFSLILFGCEERQNKLPAMNDRSLRGFLSDSGIHLNRSFIVLRNSAPKPTIVEIDPAGSGLVVIVPPQGKVAIYAREKGSKKFGFTITDDNGSKYRTIDGARAGGVFVNLHSEGDAGGQSAPDGDMVGPSEVGNALIIGLPDELVIRARSVKNLQKSLDIVGGFNSEVQE